MMFGFLRPRSAIYVINESHLVADVVVKEWCAAVELQIKRDAAPAWKQKAKSVRFSDGTGIPANSWVIVVLDDADQAGALGYHSVDSKGRVYGRVFVAPCLKYGIKPSTCFSHEVLETWGDPGVNRWAHSGTKAGWDTPIELCDAVEGGWYPINDVAVSDFLYPAWFVQGATPSRNGRLNYLGNLQLPFTLSAGGYMVRRFPGGTIDQVYGESAPREYISAKSHELSRVIRRWNK